ECSRPAAPRPSTTPRRPRTSAGRSPSHRKEGSPSALSDRTRPPLQDLRLLTSNPFPGRPPTSARPWAAPPAPSVCRFRARVERGYISPRGLVSAQGTKRRPPRENSHTTHFPPAGQRPSRPPPPPSS